jgi:hypothetical protein
METTTRERYAHIKGWGADRNPHSRPPYPMERTPPRLEGGERDAPEQQHSRVQVFRSTERPA